MHILEDEFPFGMAHFQGRTVSFREGKFPLLRFRAARSCPQNLAQVEILEILQMCRIFSSLLVALDGRRVAFVASRICCHTAKPRTKYMRLGILWWNFMRFGELFHHGTLVLVWWYLLSLKKGEYSLAWLGEIHLIQLICFDAFFMAQHGPPKKRWSETVWSLLQVLIPLIRRGSQRDTVDPKIGAGTFG